jgi:hypothetical protein
MSFVGKTRDRRENFCCAHHKRLLCILFQNNLFFEKHNATRSTTTGSTGIARTISWYVVLVQIPVLRATYGSKVVPVTRKIQDTRY